ncbi:hypothetical protein GMRT_16292 [Giardia muris]|uniref:Uncharacterized protein n=1 Tax=Giardia muris TaxID=5742 RepID=A0A4Z1T1R0_GIAMU|nr:hypothetical protein GMRT_16292 [Giardia muris]|eukprot:TNJ29638.1 hypothetical protein GMRT_16292 [Giardia muris]
MQLIEVIHTFDADLPVPIWRRCVIKCVSTLLHAANRENTADDLSDVIVSRKHRYSTYPDQHVLDFMWSEVYSSSTCIFKLPTLVFDELRRATSKNKYGAALLCTGETTSVHEPEIHLKLYSPIGKIYPLKRTTSNLDVKLQWTRFVIAELLFIMDITEKITPVPNMHTWSPACTVFSISSEHLLDTRHLSAHTRFTVSIGSQGRDKAVSYYGFGLWNRLGEQVIPLSIHFLSERPIARKLISLLYRYLSTLEKYQASMHLLMDFSSSSSSHLGSKDALTNYLPSPSNAILLDSPLPCMISTTQARMLHEILNGVAFRPPTNRIASIQYEAMYAKFENFHLSDPGVEKHSYTCDSTIRGSEPDEKPTYERLLEELRHKLNLLRETLDPNTPCILTFSSIQPSSSQSHFNMSEQAKDKEKAAEKAKAQEKVSELTTIETVVEQTIRPPFSYEHLHTLIRGTRQALASYPFAGTVETLFHALWNGTDCSSLIILLKYSVDQYSQLVQLETPKPTLHNTFQCVTFSVSRERALREAIPWTGRAQTILEYILGLLPPTLRADAQALFLSWTNRQYQRGPLIHHYKVNLSNDSDK